MICPCVAVSKPGKGIPNSLRSPYCPKPITDPASASNVSQLGHVPPARSVCSIARVPVSPLVVSETEYTLPLKCDTRRFAARADGRAKRNADKEALIDDAMLDSTRTPEMVAQEGWWLDDGTVAQLDNFELG